MCLSKAIEGVPSNPTIIVSIPPGSGWIITFSPSTPTSSIVVYTFYIVEIFDQVQGLANIHIESVHAGEESPNEGVAKAEGSGGEGVRDRGITTRVIS